jgi:acetaldehyde dehydrogenase (acetylating)
MAEPGASPSTDRDLVSIAEARALARRAKKAWLELAEFDQARIDAIVEAMATAAAAQAEPLARLAVEETGFGVVADKVQKNLFSAQKVYNFIRPMKTVGVIARHEDTRVVEIAEPFGVVAAIVPSTNPTSTAIYKILISIKARCAIVLSPHPSAVRCITRVAEIMDEAGRRGGPPARARSMVGTGTPAGPPAVS